MKSALSVSAASFQVRANRLRPLRFGFVAVIHQEGRGHLVNFITPTLLVLASAKTAEAIGP
jgi:hypothetical protein